MRTDRKLGGQAERVEVCAILEASSIDIAVGSIERISEP